RFLLHARSHEERGDRCGNAPSGFSALAAGPVVDWCRETLGRVWELGNPWWFHQDSFPGMSLRARTSSGRGNLVPYTYSDRDCRVACGSSVASSAVVRAV